MPIPSLYRVSAETSLATYNYTDIAEGTGTVIYYGLKDSISGAQSYIMTTNQIYSREIEETQTDTEKILYFATSPFNLPRTLKGTAYVSFSFMKEASAGNYISAQIQKSGALAVTNVSSEITMITDGIPNTIHMEVLTLPLTQTHIKKGDILRAKMKFNQKAGGTYHMGIDPMGRDSDFIKAASGASTVLAFHIPFRVDI